MANLGTWHKRQKKRKNVQDFEELKKITLNYPAPCLAGKRAVQTANICIKIISFFTFINKTFDTAKEIWSMWYTLKKNSDHLCLSVLPKRSRNVFHN